MKRDNNIDGVNPVGLRSLGLSEEMRHVIVVE